MANEDDSVSVDKRLYNFVTIPLFFIIKENTR